ncbi:MAG: restriction endonuclease subunit S [Candidatus Contendobacter sp.]|nr:MAG: restriction endonuclease subunit S [Candidatus Contendobacter sp.]
MKELKELPAGWRWVCIGEICEFQYGKSLPESNRASGNVAVYGSNGIVGFHEIALTTGPTIIIGRKGSIGQIHFSPDPCFPIDTTYFVDRLRKDVDLQWFIYALHIASLDKLNKASGVPGLNREDAYKVSIPLLPLPEQRRIAALLTEQLAAVEQARKATEAQLEAVCALPATYLREVFESEEAKKWPLHRISDFAETCSGTTPSRSRADYFRGNIPWIKTTELKDGEITQAEEYINDLAIKETSLKILPKGTLLIAMYGQGKTRGRTGLLNIEATINQACFAILAKSDVFDSRFLQMWFIRNYKRLRDESEFRGGNQPNLNGEILRNQQVCLPSIQKQKSLVIAYNDRITFLKQLSSAVENEAKLVNDLPSALFRQAFSGAI